MFQLAREEDMRAQIGSNLFLELLDWDSDAIRTFRIPKSAKFSALKVRLRSDEEW